MSTPKKKPPVKNYFVLNESGEIVNNILWDGVTPFEPGEGLTLTEAT